MSSSKKTIAIVGGGILGMTLALRLAQRGFKVTVLEASDRIGGLAAPAKIGPYMWDKFYHVILMSDSNTLGLLEELDLADQINWRTAKTGFFTDGRLLSMSNVFEFLTFPPLKLPDKIRLGWTIFYGSKIKSWQRLEGISVSEWLTLHSGKRTFDKIWLPLLKSKLGENYKITSASFIWAIISRMYAARRSGMKQEMFGYVRGGYAQILERFRTRLDEMGIEIVCQTQVSKIENNGNKVMLKTDTRKSLEFDLAALTLPCTLIPDLCSQLSASEKERLLEVTYEGVLCLSLILKKNLADYYVTNITDEWVPFTAVIEMTALVDKGHFEGNSLVYLPRYLTDNDPYREKGDAEITEEFIAALQSMYPTFTRDDVLFHRMSRANHVLPIPTTHYSTTLLPPTGTSLKNVFVVNSAQIANGTMNVNEIIALANIKAVEITDLLSE